MTCPHCGRDLDPTEGQRYCSFCGHELERHATYDSAELAPQIDLSTDQDRYCPWEDQDKIGFLEGLLCTLKESLFTPQEFFYKLPVEGGFFIPLLYALIIETFATLVSYAWAFSLDRSWFGTTKLPGFWIIILGVLVPILVFLRIIISAFVLHISLFLVSAAKRNFEATFRVVCYSCGPELFNVVPVVGGAVAFVWQLYLVTLVFERFMVLQQARSLTAVLLPLILCCGLIFTGIVVWLLDWVWAGHSNSIRTIRHAGNYRQQVPMHAGGAPFVFGFWAELVAIGSTSCA